MKRMRLEAVEFAPRPIGVKLAVPIATRIVEFETEEQLTELVAEFGAEFNAEGVNGFPLDEGDVTNG